MKKLLLIILTAMLCFMFTSCGEETFTPEVKIDVKFYNGETQVGKTYSVKAGTTFEPPSGDIVTPPEHKEFTGWNSQADGEGITLTEDLDILTLLGTDLDPTTPEGVLEILELLKTKEIKFYAQFKFIEYTIDFMNGSEKAIDTQELTVEQTEKLKLPENPADTNTHTFKGWGLGSSTTATDFNEYKINGNATFNAIWETLPPEPTVVKIVWGSDVSAKEGKTLPETVSVLTANALITKLGELILDAEFVEGKAFGKWTVGTPAKELAADTALVENLEVKLETQLAKYTVSFATGEDGSEVASQEVEYGKTATKPTDPTRLGHTFADWTLNGNVFAFTTEVKSDIELVATWEETEDFKAYKQFKLDNEDYTKTFSEFLLDKEAGKIKAIDGINKYFNLTAFAESGYTPTNYAALKAIVDDAKAHVWSNSFVESEIRAKLMEMKWAMVQIEGGTPEVVTTLADLKNKIQNYPFVKLGANIAGTTETGGSYPIVRLVNPGLNEAIVKLDLNGYSLTDELELVSADYTIFTSVLKISIFNSSSTESNIGSANGIYGISILTDAGDEVIIDNVNAAGNSGGIYSNGEKHGSKVTVSNSSFTYLGDVKDDSVGAYLAGNDEYTFENCTFTGATGYYTKSGTHTIIDSTVTGDRTTYVKPSYNGSGANPNGSALVVDSAYAYENTLDVTVDGGAYTSVAGYAIEEAVTAPTNKTPTKYHTLTIENDPTMEGIENFPEWFKGKFWGGTVTESVDKTRELVISEDLMSLSGAAEELGIEPEAFDHRTIVSGNELTIVSELSVAVGPDLLLEIIIETVLEKTSDTECTYKSTSTTNDDPTSATVEEGTLTVMANDFPTWFEGKAWNGTVNEKVQGDPTHKKEFDLEITVESLSKDSLVGIENYTSEDLVYSVASNDKSLIVICKGTVNGNVVVDQYFLFTKIGDDEIRYTNIFVSKENPGVDTIRNCESLTPVV